MATRHFWRPTVVATAVAVVAEAAPRKDLSRPAQSTSHRSSCTRAMRMTLHRPLCVTLREHSGAHRHHRTKARCSAKRRWPLRT
uniref:Putative secreted protein n=1 Tax=Anopheles marajoara TaxID=58244 RepID=A0A2M4CB46_9DIPT